MASTRSAEKNGRQERFIPVSGFRLPRRERLCVIDTFLRDETIRSVERECGIEYRTAQKAVLVIRAVMINDVPDRLSGVCEKVL